MSKQISEWTLGEVITVVVVATICFTTLMLVCGTVTKEIHDIHREEQNLINNPEPYPKIKEYIITEDSLGNVEVVGIVFDKPFIPPQTIHSAIRCDDYK